jgi:hypothetical protein
MHTSDQVASFGARNLLAEGFPKSSAVARLVMFPQAFTH